MKAFITFVRWIIEISNRRKILAISTQLKQLREESLKNPGLNGIQTHDLCDVGAVLYQVSYQANWELVILLDRDIPVKKLKNGNNF